MPRLFFALQPSIESGTRLFDSAILLMSALDTVPVPAGNLHATLCFIGAVEAERVAELRAAAARVRCAPVELEFDVFEYWETPGVLVAGASRASDSANELARSLNEAATAAGFSPDAKLFRAHLTLARKISPTSAEKISWPQKISPGFVVRCDRFVLMESRRDERGSIYSVVDEWLLDEKSEC